MKETKRIIQSVFVCLFIACTINASFGEEDKLSNNISDLNLKEFGEIFYTDSHIQECAEALDSLRVDALENVYEGMKSKKAIKYRPKVRTTSGILMIYTVTKEAGCFLHYFSVSRAPYLATAYGRCLVGMACERFGLPDPSEIRVSPRQVFHAYWILSSDEHTSLVAAGPPEMPDRVNCLAVNGICRGFSIELNELDIDYSEVESK
jgi:hypothetical protein